MALETVVFQQDPSRYRCKDFYTMGGVEGHSCGLGFEEERVSSETLDQKSIEQGFSGYWDSPPPSVAKSVEERETNSCSPEVCTGDGLLTGGYSPMVAPVSAPGRRKRRRTKSFKNKEEMENQRRTHIAVERNRRKLMNDYLAVLRSLMPPSYAQRGDQASIIGGAINFVKELEQLLQFLEAHKQVKQRSHMGHYSPLFANFFTVPQYSISSTSHDDQVASNELMAENQSAMADIEVTMVESHASIKILSRRQPKQILKLVSGFYSLGLTILHLNVTTTFDHMVLYSFTVKVEDNCQLSSVNEIATSVHEMISKIQERLCLVEKP